MKKVINTIALAALMVGAVACSSTPKVEEQVAAPEVSAALVSEPSAPVEQVSSAPAKDLSLGAGSSGRGH